MSDSKMAKRGPLVSLDTSYFQKASIRRMATLLNQHAEKWIDEYYMIFESDVPAARFQGPGVAIYASQLKAEQGALPKEVYSLKDTTVYWCERNMYARVKECFHFGLKVPGRADDVVMEAKTNDERWQWISTMSRLGASDGGKREGTRIEDNSIKEGYLEKLGKSEKGEWRVRYFVLHYNPARLEYFKTFKAAQNSKAKGVIMMEQHTLFELMPESYNGNTNNFSITVAGGRRYMMSAADATDAKHWFDELERLKAHRPVLSEEMEQTMMEERERKERERLAKRAQDFFHAQLAMYEDTNTKESDRHKSRQSEIRADTEEMKENLREMMIQQKQLRLETENIKRVLVNNREERQQNKKDSGDLAPVRSQQVEQITVLEDNHNAVLETQQELSKTDLTLRAEEEVVNKRLEIISQLFQEKQLRDQRLKEFLSSLNDSLV